MKVSNMQSVMHVRLATLDDIPHLCKLLGFLFAQEVEFSVDLVAQAEGLRQIIEQTATGQILVLQEGSNRIGMVILLYTISTALGGRVAILEDMIVHPAHRGRGAGSILLQAAIDTARTNHCRRITLLTDSTNDIAHSFYSQHGFTPSHMQPFRLLLKPE